MTYSHLEMIIKLEGNSRKLKIDPWKQCCVLVTLIETLPLQEGGDSEVHETHNEL